MCRGYYKHLTRSANSGWKLAAKNIMVSFSKYYTLMKLVTISSHSSSSELENDLFWNVLDNQKPLNKGHIDERF